VIKENGGEPLMWVTGHSLIKAKLKETGAPLAGEMSGHIFFKERWYGFDDGTYTAARLLEILAKDSRSTQEIFSSLPDSVNTPELNILMQEGENFQFVKDLVNGANIENAKITTIDGLRVDYDDGFGLVRASNTTPSLVIRFEAKDQAGIVRIQEEFRTLMLKINPDLQLPF
jgi:phosphomannomutase/phosphoglucomutase